MIFMQKDFSPSALLLCLLLVAYGCRLGGFLLYRELKSESYRKELPSLTKTSSPMGAGTKIAIWLSVVILYVCQVSPVLFRITADAPSIFWAYAGSAVMLIALILESVADHQKSVSKKINPERFCSSGLYKFVRCPNYFGEILFWTGCFISGTGAVSGWQWIPAALGYASIVYIMFGGARRLETRQNKRYGNDEEYIRYKSSTPVIIPFIPLYSVEKYRFLKG